MRHVIRRAVHAAVGPQWYLFFSGVRQIHRNYEPHFLEFLNMIPQGGVMLDVGANVGITCAIARRRRPDIKLIAFEPVPENLVVLRRLQRLYSIKGMQIEPVAVGDYNGAIQFVVPRRDGIPATALSHVLSEEFRNPDVERLPAETISVQMRTLDSFAFPKVDAIKIDVEDHEYHALNGARGLLACFRPLVLCELWGTENRPRTIELMGSLNYTCRQLSEIDFIFTPGLCPPTTC